MTEMMDGFMSDVKSYQEKMKEKKARDQAEDWNDADEQEMAGKEADQETAQEIELPLLENASSQEEEYAKNVESVLNSLQMQLSQIDDAESFLKSTFGDVDMDSWEDDEENQEAKQVAEELVEGEPHSTDEKQEVDPEETKNDGEI